MSSSRGGGQPAGSFAAVSPDAQTVLWGQPNGYLQFMQPRGGMWRQIRSGKTNNAAFAPDGKTLAVVNQDKSVRLWDWTAGGSGKELKRLATSARRQATSFFSGDGKTLLTVAKNDTVLRLLDEHRQGAAPSSGPRGGVECVALSADAKLAALAASMAGRASGT
jgi:WD40 repeat protein